MGVTGNAHYHDLQNNFVGIALQDDSHASLPLISVVIFCCVAARLGLDAQPCAFPFHVLAIVDPSMDCTLEEGEKGPERTSVPIYMDPFRSNQETDVQNLQAQLLSMGVPPSAYPAFLAAAKPAEIVRRCAKNIITSVQTLPRQNGAAPTSFPETDGALYAALWSLLVLPETELDASNSERQRYLHFIVEKVQSQYLMDVGLIEEDIIPFIRHPGQREILMDAIRVIRTGDNMPKQIKYRNSDTEKRVHFKVGQVFHHRRYHYQAVITGWDVECAAGETWMEQMNVRSLSRGQHQSFYHVL